MGRNFPYQLVDILETRTSKYMSEGSNYGSACGFKHSRRDNTGPEAMEKGRHHIKSITSDSVQGKWEDRMIGQLGKEDCKIQ